MKSSQESTLSFLNGCNQRTRDFLTAWLFMYGSSVSPPIRDWPNHLIEAHKFCPHTCQSYIADGVFKGDGTAGSPTYGAMRLSDVALAWLGEQNDDIK